MITFVTQSKTLVSFPLTLAIVKLTLPIGISTLRSRDVDNSITAAVAEMKIVSQQKAIVRVGVGREMTSRLEHKPPEEMTRHDLLSHKGRLADQQLDDRRTAACYLMHQETVVSSTEDSTTIEVTGFAANFCTPAVMETRITLRRLRNVKAFVMMLLASVIWRHSTVDALKI